MNAELFAKNDDKAYQDISENFKNFVQEQRNIDSHEMFMITDVIQCQTSCHCAPLGWQIQEEVTKSRNRFSQTS